MDEANKIDQQRSKRLFEVLKPHMDMSDDMYPKFEASLATDEGLMSIYTRMTEIYGKENIADFDSFSVALKKKTCRAQALFQRLKFLVLGH